MRDTAEGRYFHRKGAAASAAVRDFFREFLEKLTLVFFSSFYSYQWYLFSSILSYD